MGNIERADQCDDPDSVHSGRAVGPPPLRFVNVPRPPKAYDQSVTAAGLAPTPPMGHIYARVHTRRRRTRRLWRRRPMSEKVYDVPAEWAKRAYVDDAKYQAMYERSIKDPDGFWGEHGKRIDWIKPFTKVKNDVASIRTTSRSDGSRTASPTSRSIASTAICRSAPTRPRSSGKATIPAKSKHITYARAARASLPLRQCAEGARRQEGRPRHDLSADDPRGGLRDAGLRAHRRGPFGGVRRLLARRLAGRIEDCDSARRHHRRRGPARRPQGAAEGQCRRGAATSAGCVKHVLVVKRTGGEVAWDAGPRRLAARGDGQGRAPTARPSR